MVHRENCIDARRRWEAGVPAERIRQLLAYEPSTGVLTWRVRTPSNRANNAFNTQFAGKPAGIINSRGYVVVKLLGRIVRAHRLIWVLMTGEWPENGVDHRRGDPANNKWTNLRPATQLQNGGNRALNVNNTTGASGVYRVRSNGRWSARIFVAGKDIALGRFVQFEDAVAARKAAEIHYRGEYAASLSRSAEQ